MFIIIEILLNIQHGALKGELKKKGIGVSAIRWFTVKSFLLRVVFMQAGPLNLDTFFPI